VEARRALLALGGAPRSPPRTASSAGRSPPRADAWRRPRVATARTTRPP